MTLRGSIISMPPNCHRCGRLGQNLAFQGAFGIILLDMSIESPQKGGEEAMNKEESQVTPRIEKAPETSLPETVEPEAIEQKPPRTSKGAFYLTRIAHLLLPRFVPDITEPTGDSQVFDREGITYIVPENDGDNVANPSTTREMAKRMVTIHNAITLTGLMRKVSDIDSDYAGKGAADLRYVKTFLPWESLGSPARLDLLFDKNVLRRRIAKDKNLLPEDREICTTYLNNILQLFEEERDELERQRLENLRDSTAESAEIEGMLVQYEEPDVSAALRAINTEEEADSSELRIAAVLHRNSLTRKMKILRDETNVTAEQYQALQARSRKLQLDIGVINRGRVDHTR